MNPKKKRTRSEVDKWRTNLKTVKINCKMLMQSATTAAINLRQSQNLPISKPRAVYSIDQILGTQHHRRNNTTNINNNHGKQFSREFRLFYTKGSQWTTRFWLAIIRSRTELEGERVFQLTGEYQKFTYFIIQNHCDCDSFVNCRTQFGHQHQSNCQLLAVV